MATQKSSEKSSFGQLLAYLGVAILAGAVGVFAKSDSGRKTGNSIKRGAISARETVKKGWNGATGFLRKKQAPAPAPKSPKS